MSNPSIDELLAWLALMEDWWTADSIKNNEPGDHSRQARTIQAILEQHRDGLCFSKMKWSDEDLRRSVQESRVEVIRAFVDRVEKRLPDYDTGRGADAMLKGYRQAVYSELEAMEQKEKDNE